MRSLRWLHDLMVLVSAISLAMTVWHRLERLPPHTRGRDAPPVSSLAGSRASSGIRASDELDLEPPRLDPDEPVHEPGFPDLPAEVTPPDPG